MARVEDLLNVMINRVPGIEGQALDLWRISTSELEVENALTSDHPPALSPEATEDADEDDFEEPVSMGKPSNQEGEGTEATQEEDVGRLDVDTGSRNPLPQSVSPGSCHLS
jgi:hypothetical protein